MSRPTVDVSRLPSLAFGHRSIVWWGTMGLIAAEATMFALTAAAYLYLKGRSVHWPPAFFPPDLLWGTLNTGILIASLVPNQLAKAAAERFDFWRARFWLTVALGFATAFNIIRIFEFQSLNVWWDSNAYGSITWLMLGFHTAHILTDFADSTVLAVVLYVGPTRESHLVDVSENALYWYFVVVSWLPIYGLIYWAPRLA